MTANAARHNARDWVLGLLAFTLFAVIAIPVMVGILRATAPYGWNHILLPVALIVCSVLSFLSNRRRP
jgi:hypothetical protein